MHQEKEKIILLKDEKENNVDDLKNYKGNC